MRTSALFFLAMIAVTSLAYQVNAAGLTEDELNNKISMYVRFEADSWYQSSLVAQEDFIEGVRLGMDMWESVIPELDVVWKGNPEDTNIILSVKDWGDESFHAQAFFPPAFRGGPSINCTDQYQCVIRFHDRSRQDFRHDYWLYKSKENAFSSYQPATYPPVYYHGSPIETCEESSLEPKNIGHIGGTTFTTPFNPVLQVWNPSHPASTIMFHEFGHPLGMVHWELPIGEWIDFYGNPNPNSGSPIITVDKTLYPDLPDEYYGGGTCKDPWVGDLDLNAPMVTNHFADVKARYTLPTGIIGGVPPHNTQVVFPSDISRPFMQNYDLTYPHTSKTIVMSNVNGDYYHTNNWYDAIYRMFETELLYTDRYYVIDLDSNIVSTYVGTGESGDFDGDITAASFNSPSGFFVDTDGTLFVGDSGNNKIRKISPDGIVSTVAGTGEQGYNNGPINTATFTSPAFFGKDSSGNSYIIEGAGHHIRKISAEGVVTTFAGTTGVAGYGDGVGTSALFNNPNSLAIDSNDNVFVSDGGNNRIRKISPDGMVTTFAGTGTAGFADGHRLSAQFDYPAGVAVDNVDNIYIADYQNNRVRKIKAGTDNVITIAGNGSNGVVDGFYPIAEFGSLSDIIVDDAGNIYVTEYFTRVVRKLTPVGNDLYEVSTIAGAFTENAVYQDGPGSIARFHNPSDVGIDSKGNIFVTDHTDHRIRKISTVIQLAVNGSKVGGRVKSNIKENWFEFLVPTGDVFTIETITGSLDDTKMSLYGPSNEYNLLLEDDESGVGSAAKIVTYLNSGKYKVRITAPDTTPIKEGAYTVRVTSSNLRLNLDGTHTDGNISFTGDNDWYEFDVLTRGTYTIKASMVAVSQLKNAHMYLYGDGSAGQNIPTTLVEESKDTVNIGEPSIMKAELDPGKYWLRVRAEEMDDTGAYELNITSRLPPIPLTNGPWVAVAGNQLIFDGTASYAQNPGTTIVSYEWDLDGDGIFNEELDDGIITSPGIVTKTITLPSSGVAVLKVTDSIGDSAESDAEIITIGLAFVTNYQNCWVDRKTRFISFYGIIITVKNIGSDEIKNLTLTLTEVPSNRFINATAKTSELGDLALGEEATTACDPANKEADIQTTLNRRIPPSGSWSWEAEFDLGGSHYVIPNLPPLAP